MRLNVYIASCGFASRRGADELIKKGKVMVNKKIILQPWYQVEDSDEVRVHNRLALSKKMSYLMFYKPKGVITTLKDKFASKRITDFIPFEFKGVFPVGRLDKNSEGLLLLTNDGNLCFKLTHPRFRVEKEYIVNLRGHFKKLDLKKAYIGIKDEGDFLKINKGIIEFSDSGITVLRVVISEGKKRHLRRLFLKLGFKVIFLKRVRVGNLFLGNLKPGEIKVLNKKTLVSKLGVRL